VAKHILYNAVVTINSVDLTNRARKVSYSVGTNKQGSAAMGEVQDYSMPSTLLVKPITIEYYQDFAASNVYITHRTIWDARSSVVLTCKADSAADSATNPNFTITVFISDMDYVNGSRGDVHVNSVTYEPAGAISYDVT
jgi:hypothetical protein